MIPLFFTLSYFNSHAHMERDQAGNVRRNAVLHFNSHAHVERDLFLCRFFLSFCHFNSHAHVERDGILYWLLCWRIYFNSHAHVERDWNILQTLLSSSISTHTLTWSVTFGDRHSGRGQAFQLTRSRGAWQAATLQPVERGEFQLTRSRGAWPLPL